MAQIDGEPNWRLLGRLQELADGQRARFAVGYDPATSLWTISILRSREPKSATTSNADFGVAAAMALSILEATH